jgi:hypothetical protein
MFARGDHGSSLAVVFDAAKETAKNQAIYRIEESKAAAFMATDVHERVTRYLAGRRLISNHYHTDSANPGANDAIRETDGEEGCPRAPSRPAE